MKENIFFIQIRERNQVFDDVDMNIKCDECDQKLLLPRS